MVSLINKTDFTGKIYQTSDVFTK